jgi:hypothetical protein
VYVTRKEEKAANYTPDDGVIIKMRVRLGRHLVITPSEIYLDGLWLCICACGSFMGRRTRGELHCESVAN